jgi:hypothetical protein
MAQEDIGGTEQTSLDQEFRDAFTKSGLETEADLDNDVRQHGPALINRYLKEADARLDANTKQSLQTLVRQIEAVSTSKNVDLSTLTDLAAKVMTIYGRATAITRTARESLASGTNPRLVADVSNSGRDKRCYTAQL